MSENKNLQLESENNYEKAIIKKNGFSGIYTYLSKRYELDLFQIYKYLTCNNLISQNILLCNKDLKNEEIIIHFYKKLFHVNLIHVLLLMTLNYYKALKYLLSLIH